MFLRTTFRLTVGDRKKDMDPNETNHNQVFSLLSCSFHFKIRRFQSKSPNPRTLLRLTTRRSLTTSKFKHFGSSKPELIFSIILFENRVWSFHSSLQALSKRDHTPALEGRRGCQIWGCVFQVAFLSKLCSSFLYLSKVYKIIKSRPNKNIVDNTSNASTAKQLDFSSWLSLAQCHIHSLKCQKMLELHSKRIGLLFTFSILVRRWGSEEGWANFHRMNSQKECCDIFLFIQIDYD